MVDLATLSTRIRRIFLIVVDRGIELAVYSDVPVSMALGEVLDRILEAMLEDRDDPRCRLTSSKECLVFDDEMQLLPDGARVGSVPTPGLVYVVPRSATSLADLGLTDVESESDGDAETDGDSDGFDRYSFRELVFHSVRLDDTGGPRLERFLQGPDALFEPDPVPQYDAFISFTTPDFLVASDLAVRMQQRNVRCFLANTTIGAGSLWNDELRLALQSSRGLVLVASDNVLRSSWVLSEIGAAWILELPIVVVPVGDEPWLPGELLDRDDVQVVALDDEETLADLTLTWALR